MHVLFSKHVAEGRAEPAGVRGMLSMSENSAGLPLPPFPRHAVPAGQHVAWRGELCVAHEQPGHHEESRGVEEDDGDMGDVKKPGAEEGMIVAEDFLGVGVDAAAVPQAHEVV